MPGRKIAKCGSIAIVEIADRPSLYLRYTLAGQPRLEAVNSLKLSDARRMAAARSDEIKRIAKLDSGTGAKSVKAALQEAIDGYSMASEEHKNNLDAAADRFCVWLVDTLHRSLVHWDEITPAIVRKYVDSMHAEKLSPQTIRHYLKPITLTSRYMESLDPEQYRQLRVPQHPGTKSEKPRKSYLSLEQIELLLRHARAEVREIEKTKGKKRVKRDHMKQKREQIRPWPQAELAVLLCGLCGLRIREATRLRLVDVSAERNTINVLESKNKFSDRVIPILPAIAARVHALCMGREWVFPARDGSAPQQDGKDTTSKRVKLLFIRAGISGVTPHDLRKTFINLAVQAGADFGALQAYVGHRPATVLERHYADYAEIALLRERVVDRVFSSVKSGYILGTEAFSEALG